METIYGNPLVIFPGDLKAEKWNDTLDFGEKSERNVSLLWNSYSFLKDHEIDVLEILIKEQNIPFQSAEEQVRELFPFLMNTFAFLPEEKNAQPIFNETINLDDYSITQFLSLLFSCYAFNGKIKIKSSQETMQNAFLNLLFSVFPEWGCILSEQEGTNQNPFHLNWAVVLDEETDLDALVEFLIQKVALHYSIVHIKPVQIYAPSFALGKEVFTKKWEFQFNQLLKGTAEGMNTDYVTDFPVFEWVDAPSTDCMINNWTKIVGESRSVEKENWTWFTPIWLINTLKKKA